MKCISVKGELLRISGHEFKKKFLSNKKILEAFQEQSEQILSQSGMVKIMRNESHNRVKKLLNCLDIRRENTDGK